MAEKMKNKFKVFYVAPEVAPFASSGELGEVAGSLPIVLKDLGHEVRMMMPNYRAVNERKYILRDVIRLKDMPIEIDGQTLKANGKSAFLPDSKVQIYFLDYKPYYDRPHLYYEGAQNKGYADNAERFILFCRGCLETLKLLHWQPDVIHCNDWQTSLIPYYLKTIYGDDPFFKNTRVLLSIHDVSQQGVFDATVIQKARLASHHLAPGSAAEFLGKFSFLKAGIVTADSVATVSDAYAQEIQTNKELALGLEKVLREKRPKIAGVLNGVDYGTWNPETDSQIAAPFSATNLAGKLANKQALLKHFGLEANSRDPVIGIINGLREEKGAALVVEALDKIIALGAKLVIIGGGEEKYQMLAARAANKHSRHVATLFRREEAQMHLLLSGADMLLMPSRVEPCGLYQLFAMAYGTIPIVHATGGLLDTVDNYNPKTERGTGFVFTKFAVEDLLQAVQRAVKLFDDEKRWQRLARNAMKMNFSLQSTAENYTKLYQRLGSLARDVKLNK
jgi:starch synthase